MAFSINPLTFVITIPKADLTLVQSSPIEIRELNLNNFRLDLKSWEDSEEGITMPKTHNHNTTVNISGIDLARVIEILEPYTITFEDGSYAVNLVGANSNVADKVNLNSVSVRAQNSAGLIDSGSLTNIQYLIESMRPDHVGSGNIWYWDPYGGSDGNSGVAPNQAFKTFATAHGAAVDYNHDVIICVPGNPSGITIADEAITISKNFLFVRGPGRDFLIKPTTSPEDCVHITGNGVEISGFRLDTDVSGSWNCVHVTGGDFALIKDIWSEHASGDGFLIENSEYSRIEGGYTRGMSGHGINCSNGTKHLWVSVRGIHGAGGDGVHIEGTGISEVKITGDADIHWSTGYGINVVSGGTMTRIGTDVTLENNSLGNINDPNGKVVYEGHEKDNSTASAVWSDTKALSTAKYLGLK